MVSHDLIDGFIPRNEAAECNLCKRFQQETISCEKYPAGIAEQKPVGHCPFYDPDEQKVAEHEVWKREVKKIVEQMVARSQGPKETETQK